MLMLKWHFVVVNGSDLTTFNVFKARTWPLSLTTSCFKLELDLKRSLNMMWWYNIFSEKEVVVVVWWSTNQRTNTILDHFSPSPFLFIYGLCKNLQFCFKFQIALTKDCPDYLRAKTLGATVVSLEFVRNGLIDGFVPEQFENWVLFKTDDEI